jgi:hypothetical protein
MSRWQPEANSSSATSTANGESVAAMVDGLVTVYRYDPHCCGPATGGSPHDVATAIANLDALREH